MTTTIHPQRNQSSLCLARWRSHERRGKDSFGSSEKSCSIGFEDDEGGGFKKC
ncbi:TPA: hypothetical protein IX864_002360 [Enterococcus faecium]|uniref:hypothetical protein n=1 Tax=Enterococcus faecium TaxID=1352 RepID=UPI0002A1B6C0|nr:hypothetical protein [Enterococcus faecium]ELA87472.1 hypothetical protein OI1_03896 [Enterococcus faecium EnGen0016]HAQ4790555.1 hypothetical protein [Enterococcus faecium]HAQ5466282.1 hypothetical protein [Enterococcus faecium]HAQ5568913.1 hypothetical protein [Enterococcus faecium]HAQ5928125.1 hypothetical protein [Enterococcus faecium]